MLFLLNDVVFDLDQTTAAARPEQRQFESLDLESVLTLACNLYAEEPQLHLSDPVRARRLAWLIAHRGEGINAAQFYAPAEGCNPLLVEPRFCVLPQAILQELRARSRPHRQSPHRGSLADQMVWTARAA